MNDICLRTLKRWRKSFLGDGDEVDRRKRSARLVGHRLSKEERQRILLTCNQPKYSALPPVQIVPILNDQGLYIGSEQACIGYCTRLVSCTAADGLDCRRNRALYSA